MRLSVHVKITTVCNDVYELCLSYFTNLSFIVHYHRVWEIKAIPASSNAF